MLKKLLIGGAVAFVGSMVGYVVNHGFSMRIKSWL